MNDMKTETQQVQSILTKQPISELMVFCVLFNCYSLGLLVAQGYDWQTKDNGLSQWIDASVIWVY